MRNPRVQVRMGEAFYAALCAFADEQETTPASVLLRGAKALLSKAHKWECGTRGRPFARTRIGVKTRGAGLETAEAETGRGRRPQIDGEEV